MTAQVGDIIFFNGQKHFLQVEPLKKYFRKIKKRPDFALSDTGCWRGYYATWEILDDKLFLIDLKAKLINGFNVSVKDIFPNDENKVFAYWFTGSLVIPNGKMKEYISLGYLTKYEHYIILELKDGIVYNTYEKGTEIDTDLIVSELISKEFFEK